jgi:DNA-binding MarR family transcriptional regulator
MDTDSPSHNCQDSENRLPFALYRVLKSLVFRGDPHSPLHDLPISQLRCLHMIAESEGLKMQDVSTRLEIKLPAVSQVVDRLVKRGMVERQTDPADRRVVRLSLTESARIEMNHLREIRQARMKATIDKMNARQMKKAIEGLETLAAAAEQVEADEKVSAQPMTLESDPLVELISERRRNRRKNSSSRVSPKHENGRP